MVVVEGSFEPYLQYGLDEIRKFRILGSGPNFPYLGQKTHFIAYLNKKMCRPSHPDRKSPFAAPINQNFSKLHENQRIFS